MATPITCTRRIPGSDWLAGKPFQDSERASLQQQFGRSLDDGDWELASTPVERTDFDESQRVVTISIRATVMPKPGPAPA